ncbi:hypothetical protein [Schlesneria paludicola]|uniref:hypothetical protein n=1 Tax=Schlesneria paludicola TaxID=360056 RepID=UPI00029B019C|nr:hypothetical protein [Schlesneria paludicola]
MFAIKLHLPRLAFEVWLAVFSVATDGWGATNTWSQKEFLAGVTAAAAKVEKPSVHVVYSTRDDQPGQAPPNPVDRRDVVFSGDFGKAKVTNNRGQRVDLVINPKYAFKLNLGKDKSPHTMGWLEELATANDEVKAMIAEDTREPLNAILAPWNMFRKFLWESIKDPGFTVESVSEANESQRVRVEYRYSSVIQQGPKKGDPFGYLGYLICDSARDWCLCEYGTIRKEGVLVGKAIVEYVDAESVVPKSKSITIFGTMEKR